MSQENLDLLRRGFEHAERTGEFLPEVAHPDFVWDATTFRGGMRPETCVGVGEANKWLADWLEGFEHWSIGCRGGLRCRGSGGHNRPLTRERQARRPGSGDALRAGLDVPGWPRGASVLLGPGRRPRSRRAARVGRSPHRSRRGFVDAYRRRRGQLARAFIPGAELACAPPSVLVVPPDPKH
jgi:hypothetical protein